MVIKVGQWFSLVSNSACKVAQEALWEGVMREDNMSFLDMNFGDMGIFRL